MALSSHFPTLANGNIIHRLLVFGSRVFDLADNIHTIDHFAEDNVLVIQEWCFGSRDEELTSIGVRTGVLWSLSVKNVDEG